MSCEIYLDAQRLARSSGGSVSSDVCVGCDGNLSKCPFFIAPVDVLNDPADRQQDVAVIRAEGAIQVGKFYNRQKHQALLAH
jgi:hypothetical protein